MGAEEPHFTLSYVKTLRRYPAGAFPGWELQLNIDSKSHDIYPKNDLSDYEGQKVLTPEDAKFPLFGRKHGAKISLRLGDHSVDLKKKIRDKRLEALADSIYAPVEEAREGTEWLRMPMNVGA